MRILMILLCISTFSLAYKIQGILKNINQNTISIQTHFNDNLIITILPQTQIEVYNCGVFGSNKKQAHTKDLKKGSFVKVEGSKNNSIIIAQKIILECN
ncbi:hypothetical protein [Campylobacter armoricus]|uniref:hypothetical protein n=1 Tax=Campylobacter armoricus TaxID=2505970 RepID=UPI00111663B7|nr:hypothetical protein [Campylobacter armoricus]